MDWIILGKGFGVFFESTCLRWIYWFPGTKTQEGALSWGEETLGVLPWDESRMWRSDQAIADDLMAAGLLEKLTQIVRNRVTPATDLSLAKTLARECPSYSRAMLLAKGPILIQSTNPPATSENVFGFYRHYCSNYDASIKSGSDRLAQIIKVGAELIEIMNFARNHKQDILDCPRSSDVLDNWTKLAKLDHGKVIRQTLDEIEKRREKHQITI